VKKKLAILFGLAFVFRMVLAFGVYHPDLRNHMDWGIRFWDYGPEKFYTANVWSYTWPNQPPGTIYIFAGVRKLFEAVFGIFWWINTTVPPFPSQMMFFLESNLYPALLKLPAILADLGIAFIIYKLLSQLKSKRLGYFGALVFLVNPVVWYNSSVWGQTDSIINFVALAAFYLLLKRQLLLAVMVLSLSLYIKVSLLIFVPVFAIIVVRQKYKLVEILNAVVFSLLAVLFITLPFAPEAPHNWLFRIYKDKVFAQQLHVITANGFNIWSALTGIHEQPDSLIFAIINYRTWGYIIFAGFLVLPLYKIYKKQNASSVFTTLSLVAYSSFMLLTNMHERYLYPLFPVFTIMVLLNNKLRSLYWIISLLTLFNMYHFWWYPEIGLVRSIFEYGDRLLPRVMGAVNFVLFVSVYRRLLFDGDRVRK